MCFCHSGFKNLCPVLDSNPCWHRVSFLIQAVFCLVPGMMGDFSIVSIISISCEVLGFIDILYFSKHSLCFGFACGSFVGYSSRRRILFQDFAVLFLVCPVYLVLLEFPLGLCWFYLMGWQGFPQHWGGAAGNLVMREGHGEIFLLVTLGCPGVSRQVSRVASLWVQRGFLDRMLPIAEFSLSLLPAHLLTSQQKKGVSGPVRKESTSDLVEDVCVMPSVIMSGWPSSVGEVAQDAQPLFCSCRPGVPDLLAFSLSVSALFRLSLCHFFHRAYSCALWRGAWRIRPMSFHLGQKSYLLLR